MLKIDQEQVRQVLRKVSFKVLGEANKSKCQLTYKVMDAKTASELIAGHDKALPINQVDVDDESVSASVLADFSVTMAVWMCEVLPNAHLVKWDVAVEGDDEVSDITYENLAVLLSDGLRFRAIYNDFIDLITEISGGKPASVLEQERKNLLKSVANVRSTA